MATGTTVTERSDGKLAIDFAGTPLFIVLSPAQLRAAIIAADRAGAIDLRTLARHP